MTPSTTTKWKIERCTVQDAPALARNNMSAFWEDPNWTILWREGTTLAFLIEQGAKRQARNLLRDREHARHLKAVDPDTGRIVGYARWILPSSQSGAAAAAADRREGGGETPRWAEGQVPGVSADDLQRFGELAASAEWNARTGVDTMDDKNTVVMERILTERPYIKLDYLAVHPENKGKGIGTALVAEGILQARNLGLPIFTMAYKAGLGIYKRLGFKEVDRVIQDTAPWGGVGEYGAYFMIYDHNTDA
ncbi:acyl-CoA N-acyltransferase [Xylariaceae sp. FL0594]|nr:acyl-CoA N-acyltransferase [Xylariaceae sp. FL0594]